MPLRTAGYRWAAGPSHPGRRRVVAVAGPVAVAASRRRSASIAAAPRRRASSCRSSRRPVARATRRCPAFRTTPPDLTWPDAGAVDGRGPAVADPPVWRIDEDVLAGSTTVHVHDGGEAILADGRRLYAAETLRMTAWDADPARAELEADVVYRWQEREADRDGELTASRSVPTRRQTSDRDRLRPRRPPRGRRRRRALLRARRQRGRIPRHLV